MEELKQNAICNFSSGISDKLTQILWIFHKSMIWKIPKYPLIKLNLWKFNFAIIKASFEKADREVAIFQVAISDNLSQILWIFLQ